MKKKASPNEAYIRKHMARCIPYVIPCSEKTEEQVMKLVSGAGMRPLQWEDPLRVNGQERLVLMSFARLQVVIETSVLWPGFARLYVDKRLNGKLRRKVIALLLKKDKDLRKLVSVHDDGQKIRFIGEMWAEWKMLKEKSFKEYVEYVGLHKWSDGRWRAARRAEVRL